MFYKSFTAFLLLGATAFFLGTAGALPLNTPVVGSGNVSAVDPAVNIPDTKPVIVPLFSNEKFTGFDARPFSYNAPSPAQHWAKIVLVAHFSCTLGRQYDRSCSIFIGDTNVFFGTTPEPSSIVAPSWAVERDITDYAQLLLSNHNAKVLLGNLFDNRYTGLISGSAELDFYPTDKANRAAVPADLVIPLNTSNSLAALHSTAESLSKTIVFPTNIVRIVMDVFAESQANDEFWYTDVPDDDSVIVGQNGSTSFREVEVAVDGRPAGVAPVFPWIYTGGIDPELWMPIPGVQTLNFKAFRVNLTPFAGLLDNGLPHTVSVCVFNAQDNFATAAALLVYRDPRLEQVTGAVTRDTLSSSPRPSALTAFSDPAAKTIGPVSVISDRTFVISGYVLTSNGRIDTTIKQSSSFDNYQWLTIAPDHQEQKIAQNTLTSITTITRQPNKDSIANRTYRYRLDLDTDQTGLGTVQASQTTSVRQIYQVETRQTQPGEKTVWSDELNTVAPTSTVLLDKDGNPIKYAGSSSTQQYQFHNSSGSHYNSKVTAVNGKVTSFQGY